MKIKDILKVKNTKLIYGNIEEEIDFNNLKKDSRLVSSGDIFLGIKGDNFDGNDYWEEAFKRGAKTCILSKNIENPKVYPGTNLIIVNDIQEFLVELVTPIREKLNIPVIAVTGSVGKTSTKNIIASILDSKYKVLKTEGNLNTLRGLALTLLRVKDEEIAVIEMGMNQKGEIKRLSNLAKPDIGVITNIGTAHIGNLGSRENILKAKLEILEGLKGPIIINNDNDLLNEWCKNTKNNHKIITYGIDNESDYQAKNISYDKTGSHFNINNEQFDINVIGKHFIYNALVAFAIGDLYHINIEDIKNKLKTIPLEKDRMELINENNITIINDTYNASFDSIYYALEVLSKFPGRKIAVLGDVKELGEYSEDIHRKIGKLIIDNKIDILITVGTDSKYINEEANSLGFSNNNNYHFNTNEEAIELINSIKEENDNYLVKASNSCHFKEIVDGIK